jgi:hypothetical protein
VTVGVAQQLITQRRLGVLPGGVLFDAHLSRSEAKDLHLGQLEERVLDVDHGPQRRERDLFSLQTGLRSFLELSPGAVRRLSVSHPVRIRRRAAAA